MDNVIISKTYWERKRENQRDEKIDQRAMTQNELLETIATILGNAFLEQNQLLQQQNQLLQQQNELMKAQAQIMRRMIEDK